MKTSSINPKRPYFKGFPVEDQEEQGEKRKKTVKRTPERLVPIWMFVILGFLLPILIIIFLICPIAGSMLFMTGLNGGQKAKFFGDGRDTQQ